MQVRLILITLFLSFGLTSSAQVFKAGLIGGIAGSQIEGDGYGGYNKIGFIAGGFTNVDLSENWSTQFEIYYIGKGSFDAAHPDKGDYDMFRVKIHYIEIPVTLRYHFKKFKFEIGAYVSKFLTYSVEDEFGARDINRYPFENFDVGVLFGLNYDVTEKIIVNFRSTNSVLPVRDFENQDQTVGTLNQLFSRGWYNLSLNFSVRYQFGGGGE